ncbi:MAG TPA: sulfotransferase family protein [Gammaproteobacteria bacterium]|nr:sulfotransferase family protein [Gammaproteobacteria bacterium]
MAKKNILLRAKLKKAEAALEQGNLPEATKLYEKICQANGGNADLWARLSILKRRTGDHDQAEACGRKAVQLSSAPPAAHHALGSALHAQKRLDEAIVCYRKAIQLQPDLVEAHYYLANALRETGELEESIQAYNQLLKIDPDHFEGLNNLGAMLTNMERSDEAARILTRALAIRKDSIEILCNLGRAHINTGSPVTAKGFLEKALKLQPDFLDAHLELSNVYSFQGLYEEAISCLDTALALSPGKRPALIAKARIREKTGDSEGAYRILEPLLQTEDNTDTLTVYFDISRDIGQRDRAVSMLQENLNGLSINVAASAPFHFRLGKHFDQQKGYDTAFEHFSAANALLKARPFKLDDTAAQFSAIRELYNDKFAYHLPRAANSSELMVFIIGMPRSGTSLVEQILASHPAIHGAGETSNVDELCNNLSARYKSDKFPGFVPGLSQHALDNAANELENFYSGLSPAAKRITDKMPHNFIYVGLILQLFPHCRIIHCKRNPLDNCLSCYVSAFASTKHDYSNDLDTLGRYYGLYSNLMEHWTRLFPDRILEVRYEALVANQEAISRSMLEHCGMKWSDQCLDFHKLGRIVNTLSYDQVRQPMYSKSVGRWRNYNKHLNPLRDALDQAGVKY